MALQGVVKRWNERKGIGSIEGPDGEDIFVHVRAFGKGQLLIKGVVNYDTQPSPKGGLEAINVSGPAVVASFPGGSDRPPPPRPAVPTIQHHQAPVRANPAHTHFAPQQAWPPMQPPPGAYHAPMQAPPAPGGAAWQPATCVRWNEKKGIGSLATADGRSFFVHVRAFGQGSLTVGEPVSFIEGPGSGKGPEAVQVHRDGGAAGAAGAGGGGQESGVITRFNAKKGIGSIQTADGRDVFVHVRNTRDGSGQLIIGQQVFFTEQPDQRNPARTEAVDVHGPAVTADRGGGPPGGYQLVMPVPQQPLLLPAAPPTVPVQARPTGSWRPPRPQWSPPPTAPPMAGPPPTGQQQGTVKRWREDKGIGEITAADGHAVFVHCRSFGHGSLEVGGVVYFTEVPDKRGTPGRTEAADVSGPAVQLSAGRGDGAGGGAGGEVPY